MCQWEAGGIVVSVQPPDSSTRFETVKVDFVPAVMLYRRAAAMAEQAEQRATQFAERSSNERRLRMIDAVMETIILSQAAAEGWIYAAYRLAGEKPRGRGWRECWAQAPKIIAGADARNLASATTGTLDWLSAWRNYLVHDDDRARERLAEFVRAGSETEHLTAEMAREVITRVDAAFADVGSVIGFRTLSAPNSVALWVAYDER
jgi:hypothetical protein